MRIFCLWDIDGTLISSRRCGSQAMKEAMERVFQIPIHLDGYTFSGKLDPIIFNELLLQHGVPEGTQRKYNQVCIQTYLSLLKQCLEKRSPYCKPGIKELLEVLQGDPAVILGLCTGNIREGAWLKIAYAGLKPYFEIGAFGEDGERREHLPPIAVQRLMKHYQLEPTEVHKVVVIGDAPADIQSAHQGGYVSVAVATGVHTREELATYHPDLLLDSFEDPHPFLAWLKLQ